MATLSGGKKLEAKLRELAQKVTKPSSLRVGFLEGSTYPDGTSVPMVAAIQDFGAPSVGIPPRPFFRNMVAAKSPQWGDAVAASLKATGYDATKTMGQMGDLIAGQLSKSIVDTVTPPLAPATIARKGFAKPLISTGHMISSIRFEVT